MLIEINVIHDRVSDQASFIFILLSTCRYFWSEMHMKHKVYPSTGGTVFYFRIKFHQTEHYEKDILIV